MDQLPDLPQLESVETRDRDYATLLLGMSGFVVSLSAGMIWTYLAYGRYIGTSGLIGIGILEALTLWLVVRVLLGYSYYKTDSRGLLIKAPLRKRFIHWADVQSASVKHTLTGDPVLTLITRSGPISLTPRGYGGSSGSGYDVIASIWQRLRRLGVNRGFELPEAAMTFWEPIPDDIPREPEWANPSARSDKIGGSICSVFFAGLGILALIAFPGWTRLIFSAWLLPMVAVVLSLILPELFQQAAFVRLREDYLEAKLAFGEVRIPWSQVVVARWQRGSIVIKSDNPKRCVRVAYRMGNKESEHLVLALIGRLRTVGVPQALAIPVMPLTNPQSVKRLKSSSEGARFRAFLGGLDEPSRKLATRLRLLQSLGFVVGLGSGACVVFGDLSGILSRLLHGSGARFFIAHSPFASAGLMAGGVLLGAYVGDRLSLKLAGPLREKWKEFLKSESSPMYQKVFCWIFLVPGILGVFGFLAGVDSYARFTDSGVTINRLFSVTEESHPWSAVTSLVRAERSVRGGRVSCVYEIKFADGSSWDCDPGNLLTQQYDELDGAMQFASARSGKPITQEWRE